jgi:hypothetical protein
MGSSRYQVFATEANWNLGFRLAAQTLAHVAASLEECLLSELMEAALSTKDRSEDPMSTAQQMSVDEASRLAVTATVADLEDWARSAAVHGQVDLVDLVDVLDVLRADSVPQRPVVAALVS